MRTAQCARRARGREGAAMVVAVLALMVLMGLAGVIVETARASKREGRAALAQVRSLYLAESGVSDSIADVAAGGPGDLGAANAPVPFSGGGYWVEATDNGDETWTLASRGSWDGGGAALEVVFSTPIGDLYRRAVFAGNSSGDPAYGLEFAGSAPQNDWIGGDVYSGGDLVIQDDAVVTGRLRAAGTIVGGSGQTGLSLPIPDVAAMNYAVNHDVNVAAEFAAAAWQTALPYGGPAWQVPQASPAHVFRRDPLDRAAYTALTAKDDYFLEDPYAPFGADPLGDGSSPARIHLSGTGGLPGVSGNDKVYFVDGNLWVMNLLTNSLRFENPAGTGFRVTFVVQGNLYLSDNLFYGDPFQDGVAFVVIADPAEPDSGNVHVGDLLDGTASPIQGALRHVDAFVHAERDYLDNNLDHLGLGQVQVFGNQTAGNQVLYKRDLVLLRSKLVVAHDRRIQDGTLVLPGLPLPKQKADHFQVLSWRQIVLP